MKATSNLILMAAVACVALSGCGGAEARKARYMEKGESYLAAGNLEKASVEFRNALQIDPSDAQARYQVGRVAEKLGNPRDAVGQYLAAIESDPKQMPARAALGRLYLFGGLPDRALELVETGLRDEPENAELLTVRGAARAQLGNAPQALSDAKRALELAPDNEYAIALVASLHRQASDVDAATAVVRAGLEKAPQSTDLRTVLADLEIARKNLPAAQEQLEKVVELQPQVLSHRYRLARFHAIAKHDAEAEQALRDAVKAIPGSVDAKVALIEMLAARGQYDKAEAEFKTFAASDEDNAELQLALGRFYEAHSKPELARATYLAVVESERTKPSGLTARNRLAAMLLQQNDRAGATKLIDEVLQANTRDNDALVMRGNLALANGDAPGAIADLRAVLRDQPNAVPVIRALARAHLQNNETSLAEETLKSASQANPADRALRAELAQLYGQTGRPAQALPMLEQLVKETPNDIASLENLFKAQVAMRDIAAARVTAETVQKLRPDLALGFYFSGALDEAERKLDEALAAYARAFELDPKSAEPLTALTRIDILQQRKAQAAQRLDATIAAQPRNAIALNLKGEMLLSDGNSADAVSSFERSIAVAPHWWMPYRGLALARASAKNNDAAIAALERGVAKSREPAVLVNELAGFYERLGRPDDAIKTYEKLLSQQPNLIGAANNLAMLLVTYRKDQPSLDRAGELAVMLANVDEPSVLNTRGWVMFKRGEYENSLPLLQQAVDRSPQSPLLRYHLGMAQLRTGNRDAARGNLEAAVQTGKPFPGATEAQAALDEIKRTG